jgi:uncharacterized RDD family membrane protein YckC
MRFFNKITLQTPESVELEFTLAGIGNRAYALFIDYIIWAFILILDLVLTIFLSSKIEDILETFPVLAENLVLYFLGIQIFLAFAIYVGYFVFFEVFWQGQTPGKKWVKIRVIRDDGRPISLAQATLRALFRPIDDLCFLGAFCIILGKMEKRLGDFVAGTIVIQEEYSVAKGNLQISEEAKILAEQIKAESNLHKLLPEDFAVVRDFLQRRDRLLSKAQFEVSKKLATQIKELINLENIPPDASANIFLEAVYLAYLQNK